MMRRKNKKKEKEKEIMCNPSITSIYGSLIGLSTSGTFNAFEKHSSHLFSTFFFFKGNIIAFSCAKLIDHTITELKLNSVIDQSTLRIL